MHSFKTDLQTELLQRDVKKANNDLVMQNYLRSSPGMNECACKLFDRKTTKRREQIENFIVKESKNRFPYIRKLNIFSLGCGGLLQDFLLCFKLLIAGFSLDAYFVDKQNALTVEDQRRFFLWLKSIAESLGTTFQAFFFESVELFLHDTQQNIAMHIAHGIDFDDVMTAEGYHDVLLTLQLLDMNGFFYLAFSKHDFAMDSFHCFRDKYYGMSLCGIRMEFNTEESQIGSSLSLLNKIFHNQTQLSKHVTTVLQYVGLFPILDNKPKPLLENPQIFLDRFDI